MTPATWVGFEHEPREGAEQPQEVWLPHPVLTCMKYSSSKQSTQGSATSVGRTSLEISQHFIRIIFSWKKTPRCSRGLHVASPTGGDGGYAGLGEGTGAWYPLPLPPPRADRLFLQRAALRLASRPLGRAGQSRTAPHPNGQNLFWRGLRSRKDPPKWTLVTQTTHCKVHKSFFFF